MLSVPGNPFGVATTSDGAWSFISLNSSIAIYSNQTSVPDLVHQIQVPGQPLGESLTHNGRYLLVADDAGAIVINVAAAEEGAPNAIEGTLVNPLGGSGGIEVAVSPDDRFAFVTLEDNSELAVFDLAGALTVGFGASDFVGTVPLGTAPVGMAVSPNGSWLYVTSEKTAGPPVVGRNDGTLSVVSLLRAETTPATSVVSTVPAFCSPVRVITSSDGSVVWVTARGSNALLGFSAPKLLSDATHALVAEVQVGEAPVGLGLVDRGQRIIVANSNRFSTSGATASLAVVNPAAALAHRPALLGVIRAGRFPREMATVPNHDTLLVTNYASKQVEVVHLATLP
jgi:DNA-binding beta-propeller fold protein YncE